METEGIKNKGQKKLNGINNVINTEIYYEVRKLSEQLSERIANKDAEDCLIVKSANAWIDLAKKRPIPNRLFDSFWFEGELCILFADTNVGKSILAIQIANSISRGEPIYRFSYEGLPQKVLYVDCELSDKQFENRYSENYENHYLFSENLLRAEINPDMKLPKKFKSLEEFLINSLKSQILDNDIRVVIIDNITYLRSDNEKAKDALSLMKELKAIGKSYNVSILVLSHTPKRDSSKPLSKNDLAGSKMLINFCDSAFAIGESRTDSGLRYIKQIKQRNTECVYNTDNVVVCEIVLSVNFLMFRFNRFESELEHLRINAGSDTDARNERIVDYHNQGLANTKIAELEGLSEGAIRKILKKSSNS